MDRPAEDVELPDLARYQNLLRTVNPIRSRGAVTQVVGLVIEARGISAQIGEMCTILHPDNQGQVHAEVVGFKDERTLLMPLGEMQGIQPGSIVEASGSPFAVPVGMNLLGRVLDALARPLDQGGPVGSGHTRPTVNTSPHVLQRRPIDQPLVTGVRVIDGLTTVGKGQRIGIFAGSGVGKSTLLGMLARHVKADVNVIALIGERGREVQEFISRDLGADGLRRSVIVVSTSDQPALLRLKGAWTATVIAEYFRDQGLDVNFMMDSVTRFAMAQREIGLAVGEPPAAKGYTPSVFALLPKLMERAGTSETGTITGFYTVLMEADDLTEPITDTVRSILDGHLTLSRDLAAEHHYPAVDVLHSLSRVMPAITERAHQDAAGAIREMLATYDHAKDLVNIGAYRNGSNPQIDRALKLLPVIRMFLQQRADEHCDYETTTDALLKIAA
ncbi:MAG: FliI/YscN family ATPase [Chloroflexi bacterium]|nr:FliI/YscN family ATPase [Chloroflexota bacterium]